ncbi:alpha,alpha-trehalase TreF [Glaciecola siphonariae]|uniref:Alpha,alpha-trehalase TreF n=1 Tax=Glaciecola siphonariae TaxID=521012 RepID=A0ABV9LXF2_9ALTE
MTTQVASNKPEFSLHASLAFFESELFARVQMAGLFADSKTFADATPKRTIDDILADYEQQHRSPNFNLQQFVSSNFELPKPIVLEAVSKADVNPAPEQALSMLEHIDLLWGILQRNADVSLPNSLIPLPHPYIVPGGRFREIYYWDSYFTAIGLVQVGKSEVVVAMLKNFLSIQQRLGLIPNGSRTYYYSRSQPPVLALYIALLKEQTSVFKGEEGERFFAQCIAGLETEYWFWMQSEQSLPNEPLMQHCSAAKRVVRMHGGELLNRYWDDQATPRPESYREDVELAKDLENKPLFYRNIRAACESGWDFSSRWFENGQDLTSIQTTHIVPVDLNALLYFCEEKLGQWQADVGQPETAYRYAQRALERKAALTRYCYLDDQGFFVDYNFMTKAPSSALSLAAVVPLFVGMASPEQAQSVASKLQQDFLQAGGLQTTLRNTAQQWDAPNGWAPLQWFAVIGLQQYGHNELASTIMQNWINTASDFYQQHGCMMEKYDVSGTQAHAKGGEYEVQQGFGWTNAVTMMFCHYVSKAKAQN